MKRMGGISVLWLSLCVMAMGGEPVAEDVFARAGAAYDAQDYAQAITLYEQLLRDGWRAPELYFNLANAYYREGDAGRAIWHYMNALYMAPRDVDIRHNLQFAVQEADAVQLPASWSSRVLRSLRYAEWVTAAVVFWWLTLLCLAWMCWPGRRVARWPALVSGVLCLVSLAGVWEWWSMYQRPVVVVTTPGQEALFAPLPGSTAHFALPPGSMARVANVNEGWYNIRIGDKQGWIRQDAVSRVGPLEPGRP